MSRSQKGNCILVLLPAAADPEAAPSKSSAQALSALAEIAEQHAKRGAKLFPFYAIPAENEAAKTARGELGLKADSDLEILALNMKRGWWRKLAGDQYGMMQIEDFVDSIKLGEGSKEKLPDGFFLGEAEEKAEEIHDEL